MIDSQVIANSTADALQNLNQRFLMTISEDPAHLPPKDMEAKGILSHFTSIKLHYTCILIIFSLLLIPIYNFCSNGPKKYS